VVRRPARRNVRSAHYKQQNSDWHDDANSGLTDVKVKEERAEDLRQRQRQRQSSDSFD